VCVCVCVYTPVCEGVRVKVWEEGLVFRVDSLCESKSVGGSGA
jgi:hypothetical protein